MAQMSYRSALRKIDAALADVGFVLLTPALAKRLSRASLSDYPLIITEWINAPQFYIAKLRILPGTPAGAIRNLTNGNLRTQLVIVFSREVATSLENGVLWLYIEKRENEIVTPRAKLIAQHTQGLRSLCLGFSTDRKPVKIPLISTGHILFIGPTQRGKTEASKSYLFALAQKEPDYALRFVIIARKTEPWRAFRKSRHTEDIISEENVMREAVHHLRDVMNKRSKEGVRSPAIILMLDDMINLAGALPIGDLEEIASMGVASGVFLWISTQTDGKRGGLVQPISANMRTRIILGGTSTGDIARFAGRGGLLTAGLGRVPGDALAVIDNVPHRIVTPYMGNELLPPALPGQLKTKPVWRSKASSQMTVPLPPEKTRKTNKDDWPHKDVFPIGGSIDLDDDLREKVKDVYRWTAKVRGKPSLNLTTQIVFGYKNALAFRIVKGIVMGDASSHSVAPVHSQIKTPVPVTVQFMEV